MRFVDKFGKMNDFQLERENTQKEFSKFLKKCYEYKDSDSDDSSSSSHLSEIVFLLEHFGSLTPYKKEQISYLLFLHFMDIIESELKKDNKTPIYIKKRIIDFYYKYIDCRHQISNEILRFITTIKCEIIDVINSNKN